MKKKWIPVLVLAICTALFFAYRFYEQVGVDSKAPTISIWEEPGVVHAVSMTNLQAGLLQGVTASDNFDGDVTDSILVEQIGHITEDLQVQVVYAASDNAGNVSKAYRTVQLTDYVSPRFTLSAPLNFIYGTSDCDPLRYIGATDLVDGVIRHRIKLTLLDDSAITAEGIHNVLFRVYNSLGDVSELVLPVEVYYPGRYEAQVFLTDYLVYLPLNSTFRPQQYLYEYLAQGQITDLTHGLSQDMELTLTGTVDTSTPGVYPIGYTISYTKDGQTYYGYTTLIVVLEG